MSKNGQIKTEAGIAAPAQTPKGKRGKKKHTEGTKGESKKDDCKQELITEHMPVVKKKRKIDRFNGMPEDEVILRTLPDRLAPNLDILIIGINPGLYAAYIGHHYAGPGNHFWKCLYLSGLVPEPMNCYDDIKLQKFGIGFTNICARTTRGSADLKRKEIQEGGAILLEKLKEYKPKIAVFNGKGIYEIFSGSKKFAFGKQPGFLEGTNTIAYVMPSSSARCAQLPRAIDKVPFYAALRKLRDYVTGSIPNLDEADVTFPTLELKNAKKESELDVNAGSQVSADHRLFGSGNVADSTAEGLAANSCESALDLSLVKQETKWAKSKKVNQPGTLSEGQVISGESDQESNLERGMSNQEQIQSQAALSSSQFQQSQDCHFMQTADSTYLRSAVNVPSHPAQSFEVPFTSGPWVMSTSGQAGSPLSNDFMTGFFPGSQQFGMVGFPGVVASQHNYIPTDGDSPEKPSMQIKSEPVELEAQN